MSKTYKVITDDKTIEEEQKTVEITETKQEISTDKTTPAQLKEEYKKQMKVIENAKKRANEIIDELKAIQSNTDLIIKDIPEKL